MTEAQHEAIAATRQMLTALGFEGVEDDAEAARLIEILAAGVDVLNPEDEVAESDARLLSVRLYGVADALTGR